jgi:hypothetical protein
MADPENSTPPPEATASSSRQNQENPTNDAILRNLTELMRQDETKKAPFNSQQNLIGVTENEDSSEGGSQPALAPDIPEPRQLPISGTATDAARIRRQQRSANQDSSNENADSEEPLDVIFEEDNNKSESSAAQLDQDHPTLSEADTSSDILPPTDPRRHKSFLGTLSPIEFASLTMIFIALIAATVMVTLSIGDAREQFQQTDHPAYRTPPESLTGTLLQLSGIQCYWRKRNKGDRVQETSLILPVISIKSATGTGSLQILFHDELGKVRGDSHIYRIKTSEPNSPTTNPPITALGTEGLLNEIQFTDYKMQEGPLKKKCWTITIKESADEENWIQTGKFRMPASRL